ncbi:5-histidylcysteine sulfoxide synthase [Polynucleobacter sp. MWH-Spelu-300-X4]|uniref:5-histidylcysteine sulfoxide synthase n=1 Tax=Polynucleobacter sp. MWH-Spelu-300-X4 TaxID=2689109 RepID=UPI001BFE4394|nr:5-histidylcysteine sulfoxide synthase [Polynucleobacter sp. MWH-Spelu-300-X4]QWD80394.1 5-histidylcysteine sulfoxide synthase [Polynucleobacter sp. MWH-Spelu-300-X4]
MQTRFTRTPFLAGNDVEAKRAELLDYFHATFDRYESLFEVLSCDEAYYKKPISLRHPLIFYFGHTATFFINKFILAGLIDKRIDPRLESMFAVGVDEMSWDDLDDARYDWPTVEEVRSYRKKARDVIDGVIRHTPFSLPIGWNDPFWAVLMGIEHERIHLETSSVLMRQHDLKYVNPHKDWEPCREHDQAPVNTLVSIPSGKVDLGRSLADPIYGWDNEYGHHHAEVPAFKTSRYLVTNGEYLEFVEDGGYESQKYWDEEGAGWKKFSQALHPTFWVKGADGWRLRLLAEEVLMPWDWPVETNCLEARAFCRWKSEKTGEPVRLPTEDEWNRIYDHAQLADVPHDAPASANLHLDYWASSCSVNRFKHGELNDVVGNVWQWCETPTYPFDGFDVHPIYDDFTSPTFDDRHNIIKGGSWISAGNESRHVSRYAFRRHFFQHAGFRYVMTDTPVTNPISSYETDAMVSMYDEFHYGDEAFGVPNFMKALSELSIDAHRQHGNGSQARALDLGCATGRATFELAQVFDKVIGIDFSARFIQVGLRMAETGSIRYTIPEEGDLVSYHERRLDTLGLSGTAKKVEFWQGDACNLKDIFTNFDLILAANLIDRLYSPRRFLDIVASRLNAGGLLVLASPYTWLEEYTKKSEWIGGFKKDGESYTTLDGLKDILGSSFNLVEGPRAVPFTIRETRRKHQHTLSEVTVWKKKK